MQIEEAALNMEKEIVDMIAGDRWNQAYMVSKFKLPSFNRGCRLSYL